MKRRDFSPNADNQAFANMLFLSDTSVSMVNNMQHALANHGRLVACDTHNPIIADGSLTKVGSYSFIAAPYENAYKFCALIWINPDLRVQRKITIAMSSYDSTGEFGAHYAYSSHKRFWNQNHHPINTNRNLDRLSQTPGPIGISWPYSDAVTNMNSLYAIGWFTHEVHADLYADRILDVRVLIEDAGESPLAKGVSIIGYRK